MPSRIETDRQLLAEAKKMGRHKTMRETVRAALTEYVARCKQQSIVAIFGTIDYDPTYDYKRERDRGVTGRRRIRRTRSITVAPR
jgi:hypothetical protein